MADKGIVSELSSSAKTPIVKFVNPFMSVYFSPQQK